MGLHLDGLHQALDDHISVHMINDCVDQVFLQKKRLDRRRWWWYLGLSEHLGHSIGEVGVGEGLELRGELEQGMLGKERG